MVRRYGSALALLTALLGLGEPASAARYYVDSVAGRDTNAGTSASAPWKTLRKVFQSTLEADSTVLLKRGSRWRESLFLPSSQITVDAYGQGRGRCWTVPSA